MNQIDQLIQSFKLNKPSVLLDVDKAKKNIKRMVDKAAKANIRLRPHFKTHQSAQIGEWYRELGVECITVSSVDMAIYFANSGWDNITLAVPVNVLQLEQINELAQKIQLNLLVDSLEVLPAMEKQIDAPVNVWIKVDVGYRRVGLPMEDEEAIEALALAIQGAKKLKFGGLLCHAGHTYGARSDQEILEIHQSSMGGLLKNKARLESKGIKDIQISIGDTPSCTVLNEFEGADEIRPGNFVFFDLVQAQIGSCSEEDIAMVSACPVVGKYKEGNRVVVYGGSVHLAKDSLVDEDGNKIFGYMCPKLEKGWGPANHDTPVISLSQEVGILQVPDEVFEEIRIGEMLLLMNAHICLTSDMYQQYYSLDGTIIPRFVLR